MRGGNSLLCVRREEEGGVRSDVGGGRKVLEEGAVKLLP